MNTIIQSGTMSLAEIQAKLKGADIEADVYDAVRIQVFLREYHFTLEEVISGMKENKITTVKEFVNRIRE